MRGNKWSCIKRENEMEVHFISQQNKFWNIVKRPGNRLESRFWPFSNVLNEKVMVVGVWCMKKVFSKRGSKRLNHFSNIVISTDYEKIQKKNKRNFCVCKYLYIYVYISIYILYSNGLDKKRSKSFDVNG